MKRLVIIFIIFFIGQVTLAFEAIEFGWASDVHVNDPINGPFGGNCATNLETARGYGGMIISLDPCVGKFANILSYFETESSDFLIMSGDNINADTDATSIAGQWTRLLDCASEYSLVVHTAFGNHDVRTNHGGGAGSMTIEEVLTLIGQNNRTEIDTSYYSFNFKGYHFVILDLDYGNVDDYFIRSDDIPYFPDLEANWLLADLALNENRPTFVFGHQPLMDYGAGSSETSLLLANSNSLISIMETYGNVQAYFNGHRHDSDYELFNGIRYYQIEAACDGCKYPPLVDYTDNSSLPVTNEAGTIVSIDWTGAFESEHGIAVGETFTVLGDSGLEGDYTAHANTTAAELHFDFGQEWGGSGTPFDIEDYVENTSVNANTFEAYAKINIDSSGVVTFTDPKDADDQGVWDMSWQIDMGKVKVTIDNTKVSGDEHLYNFPVLIIEDNMPDSFWDNVQNDGSDIFVTSVVGDVEYPREIIADTFNSSTKVMEMWVKAPVLLSDEDTEFLIHYGGSGTYANSTDVWDENYVVVYHFNDDPDGDAANSLVDSTSNAVHGDPTGTMATSDLVPSQVGTGWDFNGSSQHVNLGGTTDITTLIDGAPGLTLEAWVEHDVVNVTQAVVFLHINNADSTGDVIQLTGSSSKSLTGARSDRLDGFDSDTGDTVLVADTLYHIAGVADFPNDVLSLYVDGSLDTASPGGAGWNQVVYTPYTNATRSCTVASVGSGGNRTNGTIDEVRISMVVRSAGWIGTGYNNQNDPATFYSAEVYVPVDTTGVPTTGQLNGVIQ